MVDKIKRLPKDSTIYLLAQSLEEGRRIQEILNYKKKVLQKLKLMENI